MNKVGLNMERPSVERRGKTGKNTLPFYFYRTYGLSIASQIEIPELQEVKPIASPDLKILMSDIKATLEDALYSDRWYQVDDHRCQLEVPGIARYQVESGRRVLLDRRSMGSTEQSVKPCDVRLFLLGATFGVLLHQRNWLPLHVSALNTPSGVWAFTGHSGAGKSTLGAWLHYTQGWPMVSDDVAVIKPDNEKPYMYAGPPRLKLWKDALAAMNLSQEGLVRDRTRADKYHLMLQYGFEVAPKPLRALVLLERAESGQGASIEELQGAAAFKVVIKALYRPEIGAMINKPERLMLDFANLVNKIKVYRFRRAWSLERMNQDTRPLVNYICR